MGPSAMTPTATFRMTHLQHPIWIVAVRDHTRRQLVDRRAKLRREPRRLVAAGRCCGELEVVGQLPQDLRVEQRPHTDAEERLIAVEHGTVQLVAILDRVAGPSDEPAWLCRVWHQGSEEELGCALEHMQRLLAQEDQVARKNVVLPEVARDPRAPAGPARCIDFGRISWATFLLARPTDCS